MEVAPQFTHSRPSAYSSREGDKKKIYIIKKFTIWQKQQNCICLLQSGNYATLNDPRWPCNTKSKSVSRWWQCPYQRASVHGCHGHRHLYVNRSRVWRPETARTCPEVSNKKNETHHQIRTTLFISSVGTDERKHTCVLVVLNVPDSVAVPDENLACQLAAVSIVDQANFIVMRFVLFLNSDWIRHRLPAQNIEKPAFLVIPTCFPLSYRFDWLQTACC